MECEIPENIREVSLLLTNDGEIRILNRNYRKKDKATDVLSFSQLEGEINTELVKSLGDIVISLETAKKQAKKYRHSLKQELNRLLIHGLLHLLGYDHERVPRKEAERMRRREREILALL